MRLRLIVLSGVLLPLCACSGRLQPLSTAGLPAVAAPAPTVATIASDYHIGPRDELTVTVFGEPDMSTDQIPVSTGGKFPMPLLGDVQAAGLTAGELGQQIAARLNGRYLRDARVSVAVTKSYNYTFSVQGQVEKPGVYDMQGDMTLMRAVALGEGETQDARLDDVIVLRQIDGQQYGARFDLEQIRLGRMADPQIKQNDVVVVGIDRKSRLYRTLIAALPGAAAALSVFVALSN